MTSVVYSENNKLAPYAECRYAEYHVAECRYAECRCALACICFQYALAYHISLHIAKVKGFVAHARRLISLLVFVISPPLFL